MGYTYQCKGVGQKNDRCLLKEHIYTFTTSKRAHYIVNVEEYRFDVYVVKFHLKSHSNSKWKYNLLTSQHDARRIIYTCVDIGQEIFSRNN